MNNKEAIEYLKWIRPKKPYTQDKIKVQVAIDMAIEALEEKEYDSHFDDYDWDFL